MVGMAAEADHQQHLQIIKRSIAYRAKYRVNQDIPEPTFKVYGPWSVVPHPKNRGGVPVTSLRTKELTGTIVLEACDVNEANNSAVAVEDQPQGGPRLVDWESFQSFFEKAVSNDVCMAKRGPGTSAVVGSLAHGHFNCSCRNILGGEFGCECRSTRGEVDSDKQCRCKASPILEADGTYSMAKLQAHDLPWYNLCRIGLSWELLSHKMDVEDPDAAQIISIALNKKTRPL